MKGIISVSIKIFLIFTIFNFINSFTLSVANIISMYDSMKIYSHQNTTSENIRLILPFITVWCIYIFIIIVLWSKSGYISNKIIDMQNIENINITLDYTNVLSIGLIIISIYLIISSLPRIFSYLGNILYNSSRFVDKDFVRDLTIREIIEIIGMFIKIYASYLLIKYNKKIIGGIIKINNEKSNVV